MSGRTLGDVGEFGMIEVLAAGVTTPASVLIGPGDDAAVWRPTGDVAVSTDAMVEDVHFRRAWSSPHDVGRKAVASALADLEAMGARPATVVVALSAPADTPEDWVADLGHGIREECETAGVALVGGDLTRGSAIAVVVTVLGDLEGRPPVLRSGANPGDVVAVRGRLGMAAAGLAVLARGFRSPGAVVRAHRVPEVPYGQGRLARDAGATSMIDCSDGLLADLAHVAEASGVSVDLDRSAFDVDEAQKTVAAAIGGGDPLTYILTGGDDHALIATFPSVTLVPEGWNVVGQVTEAVEGLPVSVDGAAWKDGDGSGWTHF